MLSALSLTLSGLARHGRFEGRLDERCVDAGLLRSAHAQGAGVDRAVAAVLSAAGLAAAGVPVNSYAAPAPPPALFRGRRWGSRGSCA